MLCEYNFAKEHKNDASRPWFQFCLTHQTCVNRPCAAGHFSNERQQRMLSILDCDFSWPADGLENRPTGSIHFPSFFLTQFPSFHGTFSIPVRSCEWKQRERAAQLVLRLDKLQHRVAISTLCTVRANSPSSVYNSGWKKQYARIFKLFYHTREISSSEGTQINAPLHKQSGKFIDYLNTLKG